MIVRTGREREGVIEVVIEEGVIVVGVEREEGVGVEREGGVEIEIEIEEEERDHEREGTVQGIMAHEEGVEVVQKRG